MEERFNDYTINDEREKTDMQFAHHELANSYWCKDIPFETLQRAVDNSLCFNVYHGDQQVAFARMVTDKATYAYLCDVIVAEAHRGKGIGTALMTFIMKHPDLQGLRRMTLATRDSHNLYEKFGYGAPKNPQRLMEIHRPGIYEKKD